MLVTQAVEYYIIKVDQYDFSDVTCIREKELKNMLDVGERLKSYEPLWESWYKDSHIGDGSFGKVYKLKQDFFGVTSYCVVKVISIDLQSEVFRSEDRMKVINERKRFVAEEIRNMYQLKGARFLVHCLNHAIRDLYDDRHELIGFDVLIRMELYNPLPSYLKKKGGLTPGESERMAYQIAMALNSMHRLNMLHRDIKPDNIYLDNNCAFYLGDFGVSKQEQSSSYSTLAGSQPYIAPEVWNVTKSSKTYTQTADIYSYGLTLYYGLNGNRLPFVTSESNINERTAAVFDRLEGKPFPPPENGSEKLKSVVMKCCEYDPNDRFRSMDEVLAALRNEGFRYVPKRSPAIPASTVVRPVCPEPPRMSPVRSTLPKTSEDSFRPRHQPHGSFRKNPDDFDA